MPTATIPPYPTADIQLPKPKVKTRHGTQTDASAASVVADTHIRPNQEIIYKTPKHELVRENNNDDGYDDEFLEEDTKAFD